MSGDSNFLFQRNLTNVLSRFRSVGDIVVAAAATTTTTYTVGAWFTTVCVCVCVSLAFVPVLLRRPVCLSIPLSCTFGVSFCIWTSLIILTTSYLLHSPDVPRLPSGPVALSSPSMERCVGIAIVCATSVQRFRCVFPSGSSGVVTTRTET